MQIEGYLRLAITLQNNNATTVSTSILKLIKSVYVVCDNSLLTLSAVQQKLLELYTLEFNPAELYNAIKSDGFMGFEILENDDPIYRKFRLTPEEFERASERTEYDELDVIFSRFEQLHDDLEVTQAQLKELITKYLYSAFASDVKTLKEMLNTDAIHVTEGIKLDDFSDEDKVIINAFLNWPDKEKDQFVYNAVACGLEYCILSAKKDNNSLRNIFNAKTFYLDSNVVFRLMGLNRAERQNVIQAFINKCKQAGIAIKYTNFTVDEITSTIQYHVGKVREFYGGTAPLSREAIEQLSSKYANLDFIDAYGDWVRQGNRQGDYKSFAVYLDYKADTVLQAFSLEKHTSFNSPKNRALFSELKEEYTEYKRSRYKSTFEGSIKTDIENYLFIESKTTDKAGMDIMSVHDYFITADHSLVNWAKERTPAVVPTIVLPSVWYSILLKFRGRTDNDYQAFTHFLNLRLSEEEDVDKRKQSALKTILRLEEPIQVKEAIIYQVSSQLKNKYRDIEDVEEIVADAYSTTVKSAVDEAKEDLGKKHAEELKEVEAGTLEQGIIEGKKKQQHDTYKRIVENAPKAIKSKWVWLNIVNVLCWLVPLGISIFCLYLTFEYEGSTIAKIAAFVTPNLITVLTFFGKFPPKKKLLEYKKRENLINKYVKKECDKFGINAEEYSRISANGYLT